MTLNSDKTIILPFQACDPHLRDRLPNDGLEVVANEGHTKLLGILQRPTRPHSTIFDALLPQMVARCQLWKYRGRNLRGLTPIPPPQLLIKSKIFAKPLSSKNQLELFHPTTKGGLGLPSTKEFGASLGLCSLRDSITFDRRYVTLPRWFEPAASNFTACLDGSGQTFDILYVPIPNTTPAPARWVRLGSFWFSVLKNWRALRDRHLDTHLLVRHKFDMPIWINFMFTVRATRKSLEGTSTLLDRCRHLGTLDHGILWRFKGNKYHGSFLLKF
ncbi:hypothetical protein PsorP6_005585 [Peronosclerospora sorghi]|uniref:Uncharacterized protein n=1 Tax=Peronosclerospora sorghi TaxID=230839 RepID=A0ACC0W7E3_9STRA|nr:hypothetical protein PsorP6_005585 [Peronosclerospora sorghi]